MRHRLRHLPIILAVLGGVALLAAGTGGFAAGGAGAAGAAAGVALVVASYVASTLVIAWADSVNPRLVLPLGLAAYVTKFSLFGVAMVALLGGDWPGLVPMAAGIVAGVVAWNATQIWWVCGPGRPE